MRFILVLTFLCFSTFAYSANYTWKVNGTGTSYSSPTAACNAKWTTSAAIYPGYTKGPVQMNGEAEAYCTMCASGNCSANYATVNRFGNSCPANTFFNPANGACEANPCPAKTGQSQRFQKSSLTPDGYGKIITLTTGKPSFYASQDACLSGCAVSTADQKCVARTSGAYLCRGTAYFTGQQCATGQAAPASVDPTTASDPVPANIKTDLPCKYVSNPDGTQSCTSITAKESEGLQCGTFNGQQTCLAKDPGKDETKIDTSVKSATNADGSVTTTKTDVQTKTKCTSYAPSCVSTTTTTTTTTIKSSTGELIASGQECTGANCSTSGNPDSDGDGFGDCTGDNCGEGDDGEPSNVPTGPELDDVPTFAQSFQTFKLRMQNAPIIAATSVISVPSGGACSFGSAQTFFGAISFDDFCAIAPQILNPLRYLFLAIWAWAAIRLFFTA